MGEIGAQYRVLVYADGQSASPPVATFPGTGPSDYFSPTQLAHALTLAAGDYQVQVVAFNPNTNAGSEPASAVSGKVTGEPSAGRTLACPAATRPSTLARAPRRAANSAQGALQRRMAPAQPCRGAPPLPHACCLLGLPPRVGLQCCRCLRARPPAWPWRAAPAR